MNRLTKLANKYKTDKGTEYEFCHGFTKFYEPFFSVYENPVILELGVGKGGSEKMFNAFYDGDCQIYCVDIEDKSEMFKDYENIHFFQLDLGNEEGVKTFIEKLGDIKFDVIIDDASHFPLHQYIALINFRRMLKENGIFVMEDLHTSYDTFTGIEYSETPLAFLSSLDYNRFFLTPEEYYSLVNSIDEVYVYNRRNDNDHAVGFKNRSITSVITFRQ